jgi:hypothetical protein
MTISLIETKTLASATTSIGFTSIPQTFTDLVVLYSFRDTGTNGAERVHQTALTLNSSTSGFTSRVLAGSGSTMFSFSDTPRFSGWHPDANAASNTFGNTSLYLPNYTGSTNKSYSIDQAAENTELKTYISITAGLWSNTAAITSLTLTTLGTNLAIGSTASLYGILKGTDGIVVVS